MNILVRVYSLTCLLLLSGEVFLIYSFEDLKQEISKLFHNKWIWNARDLWVLGGEEIKKKKNKKKKTNLRTTTKKNNVFIMCIYHVEPFTNLWLLPQTLLHDTEENARISATPYCFSLRLQVNENSVIKIFLWLLCFSAQLSVLSLLILSLTFRELKAKIGFVVFCLSSQDPLVLF